MAEVSLVKLPSNECKGDLSDDESTLVQVMALCRQAISHDLNQSLPKSMSPYDVTRPQFIKFTAQSALIDFITW